MALLITVELNPTPLKTGGDGHFEPAVMRGAGVVLVFKFNTGGHLLNFGTVNQRPQLQCYSIALSAVNRYITPVVGSKPRA